MRNTPLLLPALLSIPCSGILSQQVTVMLENHLAEAAECLHRGLALPSYWYTSSDIFSLERERIFRRSWQYFGNESEISAPGDYVARSVGGLPIVVVRGRDRRVRAFVNHCRHRLHQVAYDSGSRQTLQCKYHGWTYDLDGQLKAAPRSDREAAFKKEELGLVPVAVDMWGPLIFINPDASAAPLAAALGPLPDVAASRGLSFELTLRRRLEWTVPCNWKTLVENVIECYHCPTIHPTFSADFNVNPDVYRVETFGKTFAHATRRRSRQGESQSDSSFSYDYHAYFIWPSLWLSARTRESFYVLVFDPIDATESAVAMEFYFPHELSDHDADEWIEASTMVLNEDITASLSTQQGHRTAVLPPGKLLVESERNVKDFMELVVDALVDGHDPTVARLGD